LPIEQCVIATGSLTTENFVGVSLLFDIVILTG